ncbi:XRE family transcriptional regulator (plasmid) [Clostridium estertheticum]|uniref:XRE family transcriptional regulator n=1 Tax=Clostridium estertheticum TaxID=238834 RepID=A0AA47I9L2_9CLOT|nr:XRE family transcriptional regulator [Clostridium estertheticum]MBU3157730.1 XRE family transcriptional regulator [Clostridium estertheticum]MBU3201966.1 XRE family transcriptional regulator [Clostridium estertheticum]WAG63320.1 XRE family transcriptional regulator [Clostridium estertheticum]WAG68225.1 XRE family transcriptional regulator [Clostridium estertheticum]
MSICERIIKKREELGFTQTELAKRAGLKPPAISQYESGSRNPSYEALIKLSNALGVTIDYLMSGKEIEIASITDQSMKLLLRITQNLSIEKKDKLLEYALLLAQDNCTTIVPILNNAVDYAEYIFKNMNINTLPIDVYAIAKFLNITIYKQLIENGSEGLLVKGKENIIIINDGIKLESRRKFTIAILIGHAIIPWHTKNQYSIRKSGSSTLLTEDVHQMEAQDFAANLIMPKIHLQNVIKTGTSLENLKELADEKYEVSLTVLLNRLVESANDKYAMINSKNWSFTKSFPCKRPLVDRVQPNSKASTFFETPSMAEEVRKGMVPAKCWLGDAVDGETVYEESIYNPTYGAVLTLLTIK